MHSDLKDIPNRILSVALGALTQANQHAVYYDPGMDHWHDMSVLNAATAGELLIKAVIAKEHPLLIFRDLFQLDDPNNSDLTIEHIVSHGKTYGLEHLPKLLWVVTGERIPDPESFEKLRKARNAIQHFVSPAEEDLRRLVLEFIYKNVDPFLYRHFNRCAVEFHEDVDIGYDYVVDCVIGNELLFSIPKGFSVSEIDLASTISRTSMSYRTELLRRFASEGIHLEIPLTPTRAT